MTIFGHRPILNTQLVYGAHIDSLGSCAWLHTPWKTRPGHFAVLRMEWRCRLRMIPRQQFSDWIPRLIRNINVVFSEIKTLSRGPLQPTLGHSWVLKKVEIGIFPWTWLVRGCFTTFKKIHNFWMPRTITKTILSIRKCPPLWNFFRVNCPFPVLLRKSQVYSTLLFAYLYVRRNYVTVILGASDLVQTISLCSPSLYLMLSLRKMTLNT